MRVEQSGEPRAVTITDTLATWAGEMFSLVFGEVDDVRVIWRHRAEGHHVWLIRFAQKPDRGHTFTVADGAFPIRYALLTADTDSHFSGFDPGFLRNDFRYATLNEIRRGTDGALYVDTREHGVHPVYAPALDLYLARVRDLWYVSGYFSNDPELSDGALASRYRPFAAISALASAIPSDFAVIPATLSLTRYGDWVRGIGGDLEVCLNSWQV